MINNVLENFDFKINLVIVGGSAFILKKLLFRATQGIDCLNLVMPNIMTIINTELKNVDINNRVTTFEQTFGEWKNDVELVGDLHEMNNLNVYTLSTERLLASRFFSNKRYEDIMAIALNGKLIQEKFEKIIMEIFGYSTPIYDRLFNENKYLMKKLFNKKRWNYEGSNIKKLYEK